MEPTLGEPERHPTASAATSSARNLPQLQAAFLQQFPHPHGQPARRIRVVRSPGRVNLIGEHTDYNDGFVFPMAIEPEVRLAYRGRSDGIIRLASTAFPDQIVEFSLQKKVERGAPPWADYVRGVAAQLLAAGIPLCGMDLLIDNTLPVGSGLSSSAAIEVGTATAFLALAGLDMDAQRVALLCQKAEHLFAGVPCGIMDQTIVAGGVAGHAMLLDCRNLAKQQIAVDPRELRVVVINSMVKHALTGGEYAERRSQCQAGVLYFQQLRPEVKALRDVTMADVADAEGPLPDEVFRRCRHVVSEIARTVKTAGLLAQRDYDEVGKMMLASHVSLRDDFQVSTRELDLLVELAMKVRGVYGARLTGAGFGGSIVALAQPRAVDQLTDYVRREYTEATGKVPDIFVTTATAGAGVLA